MSIANIDVRKLHHIAVLARTQSFVKAAQELNLTQSALTRSIQSVEARFSVRLFDRDRSGVHLTSVGRELLRRAQPLMAEANDLASFLHQSGRGEAGEVAFGMATLAAKLHLAAVTLDLFATKPGLRFSVAVRNSAELIELLVQEKIEFFIASDIPKSPNAALEVTELDAMPTTMAVREGHPLLSQRDVTIEDVAKFPIVVSQFERTEVPEQLPPTMRSDDYGAMRQVTLQSDAIWFTTMPKPEHYTDPFGLVQLPFPERMHTRHSTLRAARLARRTLSPASQVVFDNLKARCGSLRNIS